MKPVAQRGSTPTKLLVALVVGGFASLPLWQGALQPYDYQGGRSVDNAAREERNSSAFAQIIGQFRTSFADLTFIKTERYLHSGVAYMPHLNVDEMAKTGEIAHKPALPASALEIAAASDEQLVSPEELETKSIKPGQVVSEDELEGHSELEEGHFEGDGHDHSGHDHAGTPTIIRSPQTDFRGFIGVLEREVKPWKDPSLPHQHTSGTELLPWYRVMTLADPRNVRGYMIGAWWVKAQGQEQLDEAYDFINEGVRNNPDAFQVWMMKGRIETTLGRNNDALASFERSRDLALAVRPRTWTFATRNEREHAAWTEYMEDDFMTAARLHAFLLRDMNRPADAVASARRTIDAMAAPDHILSELIRTDGIHQPTPK